MQIELQQNPQRYSSKSGVYTISSQSEAVGKATIKPVVLNKVSDKVISLDTKLDDSIKGVIVWIEDLNMWMASPNLVKDLEDSIFTNPHYTYEEFTSILGAKMGKSIPILKVNLKPLRESIGKEKVKGSFAGVKSVEWALADDDTINGLIEQINWTLSPTFGKPKDGYSIFDLNLSGDYSIDALKITPLDENARINEGVLAENLKVINERLSQLRADFQSIKDIFYFGKTNPASTTKYNVLASVEDGDDYSVQVISKDSVMVSKTDLPSTQQADIAAKAIEEAQKKLQGELDARNKSYDEILAKWNAYGFTPAEGDSLKNPKGGTIKKKGLFKKTKTIQQSAFNINAAGKDVNINIEWLPTVLTKAKIVDMLYGNGLPFTSAAKKRRELYKEYYGTGKSPDEYNNLNAERKGELLSLALQIVEIEAQRGVTT